MIEFQNVTKSFRLRGGERRYILRNASMNIPSGEVVGFLGRNGAGKSTTLRIIAGTQGCDSGRIVRHGSVSWPIGFAGSFHPELTGAQNTRFVARVYGVDTNDLLEYVRDFSELGKYFEMPFRTYSSGMRARLAFGVSMGVPFDTYLVDEVTTVGDANFRQKCNDVFTKRLADAGAIIVSHSLGMIAEICTRAVVLEGGEMHIFDDVQAALEVHSENMKKTAA
ncbi:ABC transporter ATP-binding protein [uncultured Litoreibacter sp.]|uniref:ABC transporter ATP-binding protein n=1 Tax=uncultured Litoreibacter sp. TaxID=1392394 RepID=UPI0026315976|nr:ABC transporter ATP-binding protein [uncultured Litoreibacter sp.]